MAYYRDVVCLLLFLCHLATAQKQARFCVTSVQAKRKCEDMKRVFDDEDVGDLTCIQANSQFDCMAKIAQGTADVAKISATELYAAQLVYDLIPILREAKSDSPNDEGYLYKAVIVVRTNAGINSIDQLFQKKSCHTGVGRTVGWTVPVSNLQARGTLPVVNCDNTVLNVADFFSKSCAPGAYSAQNNVNNDNPANVCDLCKDKRCPDSEVYGGYRGAIQCLIDQVGDVAFAKHSTINDLISSGMSINKENFRLLCPDNTLKHVDDWNDCNWATRPTDVVVTSSAKTSDQISGIRSMLSDGAVKFNSDTAAFNMFSSSNYDDDGEEDVIFTDGMKQLLGVTSTDQYLEDGFMNTMIKYTPCNITERWCVVSDGEQNKCNKMRAAFAASRISNRFSCVRAQSHKECMEMIEENKADLVTLDGGDVYTGGKYHSLVPIMSENYGTAGSTSYWAVAVVKKSNTGFGINDLKGKKSCHTGIQKTSGWNIPIGTLIEKGSISKADSQCGIIKNVGEFFSESCVPGALSAKYDPTGENPTNLCKLCGGKDSCQRDSSNKYYGYSGAFRCLVETGADVAFVKHTTVTENTDGKVTDNWAKDLNSADFELLCPDGTRAPVTSWQNCNLAQVPSHVVVTSSKKSESDRRHYATILKKGQIEYGAVSSGFQMFESESQDEMFDDSTTTLSDIMADRQEYSKWLGDAYTKAINELDKKSCVSAGTTRVISLYALALALLVAFVKHY